MCSRQRRENLEGMVSRSERRGRSSRQSWEGLYLLRSLPASRSFQQLCSGPGGVAQTLTAVEIQTDGLAAELGRQKCGPQAAVLRIWGAMLAAAATEGGRESCACAPAADEAGQ